MPKRRRLLIGLAMAALLLAMAAAECAEESAPRNASPRQDSAESLFAPGAGEKDFLAALESAGEQEEKAKDQPVYVTALSFIFKLALVLALAYATILGLKRFTGVRGTASAGRQRIRIMENSTLGANRALHLVEVGSRVLLVASTSNQVNLIAELSSDDLPEVDAAPPVAGFRDQLSLFLGAKPDTSSASRGVAEMLRDSSAFLQGKVGEVGKLRGKFRHDGDA